MLKFTAKCDIIDAVLSVTNNAILERKCMARKKNNNNWSHIEGQKFGEDAQTRDVHGQQTLVRGKQTKVKTPTSRIILAIFVGLLAFAGGCLIIHVVSMLMTSVKGLLDSQSITGVVSSWEWMKTWQLWLIPTVLGLGAWGLMHQYLMLNLKAQNAMADTSDINQYVDDQHIMLFEEMQRKFDWFPNVGAHSSVSPSGLIGHVMMAKKGLKMVDVTVRRKKTEEITITDEDGNEYTEMVYEGEPILNSDGTVKTQRLPIIDEDFGQDLFTESEIPWDEKETRKFYNVCDIPYNPKDKSGRRDSREKLEYDTVADLINGDWELPEYETQRPAGAYLVDTEPINTMVLAITRAGKGQT